MSFIHVNESDNYMTPKCQWERIKNYIPNDKKNMESILWRWKTKTIF